MDDILIITAPLKSRSIRRTGELRYAVPPYTTTEAPRLQEQWRYLDNGESFWRDIPTVVVDGLKPRPKRGG